MKVLTLCDLKIGKLTNQCQTKINGAQAPIWKLKETNMKYIRPVFDDDFSEDIPANIADLVEQYLINSPNLSDYIEETDLISDQVLVILYDANDDKLGRIRDLYNSRIRDIADFVEANYDVDGFARWMLSEIKDW